MNDENIVNSTSRSDATVVERELLPNDVSKVETKVKMVEVL
jgi:hypothetical protein